MEHPMLFGNDTLIATVANLRAFRSMMILADQIVFRRISQLLGLILAALQPLRITDGGDQVLLHLDSRSRILVTDAGHNLSGRVNRRHGWLGIGPQIERGA